MLALCSYSWLLSSGVDNNEHFVTFSASLTLLVGINTTSMIYAAIALFSLAAILGIAILIKWLTKKEASRAVVYSHGIVAAIALVLLVVYALQHKDNYPQVSLILFIIAAVFGFYMFFRSLQQKMSPLSVAFIHALLAVGGFVMLLTFVFM